METCVALVLSLLQLCWGSGDLLGLDAKEKQDLTQLWKKKFPNEAAVKAWIYKAKHAPPLSEIPPSFAWSFIDVHKLIDAIIRHLDNVGTVQKIIKVLADFEDSPPPVDDSSENNLADDDDALRVGMSNLASSLNVLYINVLRDRVAQNLRPSTCRVWDKLVTALKTRITDYNQLKFNENYFLKEDEV